MLKVPCCRLQPDQPLTIHAFLLGLRALLVSVEIVPPPGVAVDPVTEDGCLGDVGVLLGRRPHAATTGDKVRGGLASQRVILLALDGLDEDLPGLAERMRTWL